MLSRDNLYLNGDCSKRDLSISFYDGVLLVDTLIVRTLDYFMDEINANMTLGIFYL